MLKFCDRHKGAISIFLTLILIPTFIFGGVMVDGSRILGAKNLVSGAGDLALNAALSDYNEDLNDAYGLLAMADTAEEVDDILQDYFVTTLNANGISEEDFSKALIYLELADDDFSVSNVDGTEIYQTQVLKQEMLEYIKYREPAVIIKEQILDRLKKSGLEETSKQKEAAKAELDFESALDDLQDLMDDVKNYTDSLQNDIYKNIRDEAGLNALLQGAEKTYEDITMLSVAYDRMQNCSDTQGGDAKSLMKAMVSYDCDVSYIDASVASNLIHMKIIENSMQGKDPDDVLDGLDKDSEEYHDMEELISDYEAAEETFTEGVEATGEKIDNLVTTVNEEMSYQRRLAEAGSKTCGKIQKKMEDIEKKLTELKEKYAKWEQAVDALEDSDIKKGYQDSLEKVKGLFGEEDVRKAFVEKIKNNKTFYDEVVKQLDEVTFTGKFLDAQEEDFELFGMSLDVTITKKEDFLNRAAAYNDGVISKGQIEAAGRNFMNEYHDIGSMSLSVENIDVSDDEFVQELKDFYCKVSEGSSKEKAKETSDDWATKLTTYATKLKNLVTTSDIDDVNVDTAGKGDLPHNWLSQSTETANTNDGDVKSDGGLEDKSDRKKMAESGEDTLDKDNESMSLMSGLAENLSSLGEEVDSAAEGIAEPVLLTGYVLEMFSNYVSDKVDSGTESLSGTDMKDNALYRAEVEYILWGQPDIRNDVAITKAIIFATNFVFNLAFAFTNGTLNEEALAVAAVFPVGAPAQLAIKCALQTIVATIETTSNMMDLMDGKKVPLIKSEKTWDTWIIPKSSGKSGSEDESGLSYKDYLWIMVCAKMFSESFQTAMLARTADCIELNMTDSKKDNDNSLHEMYTMIDLEAEVGIDTYFLPRLSGAGYNVGTVDENTFKVKYYGVQGY